MTGRSNLVHDEAKRYAFIIYHPIYVGTEVPGTVAARRQQLRGYAAGVFVVPELLATMAKVAQHQGLAFVLLDNSAAPAQRLLYDSRTPDNGCCDRRWQRHHRSRSTNGHT